VLLAVSGGKDSVLMTHLFAEAGFKFGIAHCNFQLRGQESDLDEAFVQSLANHLKVQFHSTRFYTEDYASENHISIQMAARDLRYDWLEKIRKKHNYSYLAAAHHLTDSVETVLLNLLRGTGIAGLSGISPRRDKIIRPLLEFTGKEVEDEVNRRLIAFREDASNSSTKYKRNSIRLEVLPVLHKINPEMERTFWANSKRFQSVESFLTKEVDKVRSQLFIESGDEEFTISISKLKELDPLELWLYELFKPYGFSEAVLADLQRDWNNGSGRQFYSLCNKIVVDREKLILQVWEKEDSKEILIEELPKVIEWYNKRFRVYCASNEGLSFESYAQIGDYDSLQMPLKVRSWEKGDRFTPLGMKGHKKISDYFISLKIPVSEKAKIPIIEDARKSIIAVLPMRIDDHFKITSKTKKVIIFEELKDG